MANANDFSKEERIAWEELGEKFDDALVLTLAIGKYETDQRMMERSGDVIRRPMPYIARSFTGVDQTNNFQSITQMTVPASIDRDISVPFPMTDIELRDDLQNKRFGDAAIQKLASDINLAVMDVAANQGTIVVTKSSAASDFQDVAKADTAFNRVGVQRGNRYLALSSDDYNGLARDLANRSTMTGKPTNAYEDAFVGRVSGFETLKLDYANVCNAAAGGGSLTVDTRASATNYHVPKARLVASNGPASNYDNRYQDLTISDTTGVLAGDCFTIAGVQEVHHITKRATGTLKTFRVIAVKSSTVLTISPPLISAQGLSDAEYQYQNVSVSTSASAAIVFLNTVAKPINPFWHKDAIELLPGRIAAPADAGVGVMRMTTANGIEVVMYKQFDIKTRLILFRLDVRFGVVMKNPEMCGIELFSQT
jgi:hypothetical protein